MTRANINVDAVSVRMAFSENPQFAAQVLAILSPQTCREIREADKGIFADRYRENLSRLTSEH